MHVENMKHMLVIKHMGSCGRCEENKYKIIISLMFL